MQLFLLEKLPEYSFSDWQQLEKCSGRSAGLNAPGSLPEIRAWRRLASVPDVIRMPSKYCKCPVDLFGQYQARQFVGQCHRPQGEDGLCLPGGAV